MFADLIYLYGLDGISPYIHGGIVIFSMIGVILGVFAFILLTRICAGVGKALNLTVSDKGVFRYSAATAFTFTALFVVFMISIDMAREVDPIYVYERLDEKAGPICTEAADPLRDSQDRYGYISRAHLESALFHQEGCSERFRAAAATEGLRSIGIEVASEAEASEATEEADLAFLSKMMEEAAQ